MLAPLVLLSAGLAMAGAEFACAATGYFPHTDCSQFYRCTDLWGTGEFQQYSFQCAAGTVFDSSLGVCNWPQAVAACGPVDTTDAPAEETTEAVEEEEATPAEEEEATPAEEEEATPAEEEEEATPAEEEDEATPAVETTPAPYQPAADSPFQCLAPGIQPSSTDCSKFWLCQEEPAGSRLLQSLLYRCPAGYLFSTVTVRCAREEGVSCPLAGVLAAFRGVATIQLREDELDAFFGRFAG